MKKTLWIALLAGLLGWSNAQAASTPVGTQVPGYHRLQLGELEITALYDGYNVIDRSLLKGASEQDIQRLLADRFLDESGVQTAVNAFLINTGDRLVLIDTGSAQCFGPSLGRVGDNLSASGYRPEQVDLILLTHLHPDHVCGLRDQNGGRAFPNAQVRASKTDADYWLSEEQANNAPESKRPMFKMARESILPYISASRFGTFTVDDPLLPGLTAVAAPGHTPGHTGYRFDTAQGSLLFWGDIVHSHAVQFARPEVAIDYDSDQARAVETRRALLAETAENRWWIGGAHLPFPGIGHVHADGQGYRWVPLEYSPLPDGSE